MMLMMRLIVLCLSFWQTINTASSRDSITRTLTEEIDDNAGGIHHARAVALVEWLQSQQRQDDYDYYMHPNLEIRQHTTVDGTISSWGLYATLPITKFDSILKIPKSFSFGPEVEEYDTNTGVVCTTAKRLWEELYAAARQNTSSHAPYIDHLLQDPSQKLPSAFSDAGKELLKLIVGRELPPDGFLVTPKQSSFADSCGEEVNYNSLNAADRDMIEYAYTMSLQREKQQHKLPPILYNLMAHATAGRALNTYSKRNEDDGSFHVRTLRNVEVGEQLYTNYYYTSAEETGVPELFRDYGIVQQTYPQYWYFPFQEGKDVSFALLETTADDGDVVEKIEWLTDEYKEEISMRVMKGKLQRLESLNITKFDHVPEFEIIGTFYKSMVNALRIAVYKAYSYDDDDVIDVLLSEECTASSVSDATCWLPSRTYDQLESNSYKRGRYGWNDYPYLCLETLEEEFAEFHMLEKVKSQYQEIRYFVNPTNHDTCFRLDGILQICDSYRPHYHELVVHYTSSFFQQVKRVAFVGAGDSMLLHEILKYPSVELVLGLEIDQKVTRGAFKHFGTQPHWDNQKVQWWYGDAGSSLLVLPTEFFGSFDMVLVDLSETVTSNLVTTHMDVMTVLSLLLVPNGILVKNEDYFSKLSPIFEHTMQVRFQDVPCICAQTLAMGSPGLQFLQSARYDHSVLAHAAPSNVTDGIRNDYSFNNNSQLKKLCSNGSVSTEDVVPEQTSSPGVLMLIEAENVSTGIIQSPETMEVRIATAIESAGFHVLRMIRGPWIQSSQMVAFLEEGYVSVRCWQQEAYCALDLFLWNNFEKQDMVKNALLDSIGCADIISSPSYRIVTGGMFGLPTWKADAKRRGPPDHPLCRTPTEKSGAGSIDLESILMEGLSYIDTNDSVLAVTICGNSASCSSEDVVARSKGVGHTLALSDCSGIGMLECEYKTSLAIDNAAQEKGKIGLLVLDHQTPKKMAQIVLKIFQSYSRKVATVKDSFVALALVPDPSERWRRNFVQRIQRDVMTFEPAYLGQLLLSGDRSAVVELDIASSFDVDFFDQLTCSVDKLERVLGLAVRVQQIRNGLPHYQAEFVPTHFGLPSDNNQTAALNQWHSQRPMARQTIYQSEIEKDSLIPNVLDTIQLLVDALASTFVPVIKPETSFMQDVGDGYLVALQWEEGSLMFVYDGRSHVDVNLFSILPMQARLHRRFWKQLQDRIKILQLTLRDEQPRGFGGVVVFPKDIQEWPIPHWAMPLGELQEYFS